MKYQAEYREGIAEQMLRTLKEAEEHFEVVRILTSQWQYKTMLLNNVLTKRKFAGYPVVIEEHLNLGQRQIGILELANHLRKSIEQQARAYEVPKRGKPKDILKAMLDQTKDDPRKIESFIIPRDFMRVLEAASREIRAFFCCGIQRRPHYADAMHFPGWGTDVPEGIAHRGQTHHS